MLTKEQYLLTVVMEECAEVAQRASKAIRFGLNETQPTQKLTNAERIVGEVIDLYETLDELFNSGALKFPDNAYVMGAARRVKIQTYLERAQAEGRVEA